MGYREYLDSHHWRTLRLEVLARTSACERCNERPARTVHHKNYLRLGRELPEDLAALCWWCHREVERLAGNPKYRQMRIEPEIREWLKARAAAARQRKAAKQKPAPRKPENAVDREAKRLAVLKAAKARKQARLAKQQERARAIREADTPGVHRWKNPNRKPWQRP